MRSEGPLLGPYQAFLRFLLCLSWAQLMGCSCHVAFRAPLRSRFCSLSLITCPTICEAQAAEKWGTLAAGESPTVWTGHPGWRVMGFFSFRGSNTLPGNREDAEGRIVPQRRFGPHSVDKGNQWNLVKVTQIRTKMFSSMFSVTEMIFGALTSSLNPPYSMK